MQHTFRLLDLPLELRNMVYEFALSTISIRVDTHHFNGAKAAGHNPSYFVVHCKRPALLAVSRQIQNEVIPYLNSYTTVEMEGTGLLEDIARLLAKQASRFKKVTRVEVCDHIASRILQCWDFAQRTGNTGEATMRQFYFPALRTVVWPLESTVEVCENAARWFFAQPELQVIIVTPEEDTDENPDEGSEEDSDEEPDEDCDADSDEDYEEDSDEDSDED